MRQPNFAMVPSIQPTAQAVEAPHRLMRGVMYGLILALPIWLAVGYATIIRH